MFREDNTGFINFPIPDSKLTSVEDSCTLVYIVAFETQKNKEREGSDLGNISMALPGIFVSDDVISRPKMDLDKSTLDSLIDKQTEQNDYDSMYFPNIGQEEWMKNISINFITAICVGWCNQTFEFSEENKMWNASFKDLTHEGKILYYGIKKLHNSKEVRILTFNTN